MADAGSGIEVRTSSIQGAGLGVFATTLLPRRAVLGRYCGEHLTQQQYDERYPDGELGQYVLQISKNLYVDARDAAQSNWPRYINDPRGSSARRANVEFIRDGSVRTLRAILPGEEILVDYGPYYFIAQN